MSQQDKVILDRKMRDQLDELAKSRAMTFAELTVLALREILDRAKAPLPNWWETNARFRYLHPGNDFEAETGLIVGERVQVVGIPNEGFLEPGAIARLDGYTWDAAGWYVDLVTDAGDDDTGAYRVWEVAPIDRTTGEVYT